MPTITTSTGLSLVVNVRTRRCHVLGEALGVDFGVAALNVQEAHRLNPIRDVAIGHALGVAVRGDARKSDEPPADLVLVPAMQWIGKEAFLRVLPQEAEEQLRRYRGKIDGVVLQGGQDRVLLLGGQRVERLAMLADAMLVRLTNRFAIDTPAESGVTDSLAAGVPDCHGPIR